MCPKSDLRKLINSLIVKLTKLRKTINVRLNRDEFMSFARKWSSRRVIMRFLIANAFFVSFVFHVQGIHDGDVNTGINRSKQDEWNDLLQRFRQPKRELGGFDDGRFFQDEPNGILEDEATDPLFASDWDRLVNGDVQTTGDDIAGPDEDLEGEKAVRGASLAFVFDTTGSMGDELRQVKAGASQILAALRDHPDAPIYNYIWVPFNDPEIGPITVTTDHQLFQKSVQDVAATGGGDCPEMSIGAIKKALEASLPNSYIYVFTDASAKDYKLQKEVLSLIQRKQTQVVFILTDTCIDMEKSRYQVYERIAETSSGQIYRLSRNEVNEVLKYVKLSLQPHKVSLGYLNKPAPDKANPDKLNVVVDESLKQFTVSVSGVNATINVTDPKGVKVDGPPKLENVLNLTNIKVVNVKEPDPGPWSVYINSDSNYTVRSTGLSKVNFNHGFSSVETVNLKETNYRPLKGAKSFILIQTSDVEKVHNITKLDFISLSGDVLQDLNLSPVPGMPGLYKAGSFEPPSEFFYLGVTGFGQDGRPFQRVTSTAVSAQLPEKPIITTRARAVGKVHSSGFLKCYVESVVPFTAKWFKNGVFTGEEKTCSETCEVILNFENFTMQSEGVYSCSAKNVAGLDSKSINLTITGDAPSVTVNSTVITFFGERVYLDCLVESHIPYVVKWMQFTTRNQHSGVLHAVSTGVKLDNNTLLIESAKPEDEGWYVCHAVNKGGESKGRVLLIVKEPLLVKVEPTSQAFVEGDSARFSCSGSGKPQPRLEWVKDQQPIKDEDPSIFVEEINGSLNLVISYLEKKNAGVYTCNAENAEETVSATAELIYTEKPTVKAKENNVMVNTGSLVVLQCTAVGYPEPVISWFKGENEIVDSPRFQVEGSTLRINSAISVDTGEYSCVARNDLGSDADYIGLIVGSPPNFLQKPKDKKIQVNHNGTVGCSAIGAPPPEIKWRRSDGKELDSSRIFTLSSGALRITRMQVEDAGLYTCTAENVFASVSHEVSIKVSGVEKPTLDLNMELRNVEAHSGNDLSVPCGIVLGSPPALVTWFKDGVEVRPSEKVIIEENGNLLIRNASAADRGNYSCLAKNAVGNIARHYDVLITASPKIKETNETGLKRKLGGEIIIPCSVEGFPLPTVTWTKNGLPLPMSSTIFQDENGSLIIRNLTEGSSGVYVCTAINALGSASKSTSIHVQVPPAFTADVQDSSVNVVEGHVVILNCNASGVPEPRLQWYKNEEPLIQNKDQPKILRFVASVDDTGVFKCVVENEAGSSQKEFNVTILVPPKILGRSNEESIKAKIGVPITLLCNVFGVPAPTILWQRNGMYLTQNTSEVTITDSGALTIHNVTVEAAGAYTCDAENIGGITQRIYYLQVTYPPKIHEEKNVSKVVTLKEGEAYSLACLVEGNPKPKVAWRKNGLPIHGKHQDLIILEDNTLVFLQVTGDTAGVYKCEAFSSEGSASREQEIKVVIPPSLTSDSSPTRLEVNEGDSLALTCPTTFSKPPPRIQWIKDGEPLDALLQERSDEARMKLSPDERTLTITEAHPSNRGNYSCVATNLAGRAHARFLVDVLMTPHFEEFNHVAHRTILTGGEVVLNCSVSGNPQPKVTWRKEQTPITPHNTPGVHVSLDKQFLTIVDGRIHHTGTYICSAANKVNSQEREFYVTVLEPPQITGPLQQTIDVMMGDNVTLNCEGSGVPAPVFRWTKQGNTKISLNNTENHLNIINATCEDTGQYLCDVANIAGTRTKYFEVTVLEPPRVEDKEHVDEVAGVLGGNVTLKCKTSGHPKPEITWLHNGRILRKLSKRSVDRYEGGHSGEFSKDGYSSLTLTNVREQHRGTYTLLAFNKAGVVQKKFNLQILVPPRLLKGHPEVKFLTVVQPFPVVLKCPTYADPPPLILWFFGDVTGRPLPEDGNIILNGNELRIKTSSAENSGVYACLSENPAGKLNYYFNVTVIEPPKPEGSPVADPSAETQSFLVNDTLTLHCNTTGHGVLTRTWFHTSSPIANSSDTVITDSGKALVIPRIQLRHSGAYTCLTTNVAGSTEIKYQVEVHEPPSYSDDLPSDEHKIVHLHHPFSLYCFFMGHPPPEITWFKDGYPIYPRHSENSILSDNSYLEFSSSKAEDAGDYTCVARNKAGVRVRNYKVEVVVSGDWGQWSVWSECSVTCGLGEQVRRRTCSLEKMRLHPRVRIGRLSCAGESVSRRKCFKECQEEGNWGSWSACSVTCGRGVRRRFRLCINSKSENNQTGCKGQESMEEVCHEKSCPVNGQWSEWSHWSECSDPCGSGVMQRVRKCNSPAPQQGGDDCPGWGTELKICNRQKCLDKGTWLPWSEWSECSETCGKGFRRRHRACERSKLGGTCKGENLQVEKCLVKNCLKTPFPRSANLYVKGNLNGKRIDNRFDVSIENRNNERQISANMDDLLKRKDKWFPYTPFLLSPVSWNTAYEVDNADNGYSLTDGNFFSQSEIQFASGEELKVKHKGDGMDDNGTLTVEIEVVGEVPLAEPHSYVLVKPIEQDFLQTGPNTLFSSTQGNVTLEGRDVPYVWNSSIRYNGSRGPMPYLVEKLSTKEISHQYDRDSQNVSFTASSTIGKKFDDNQCPAGFIHDPNHMHCQDVNECETSENPCQSHETCSNTFGSFKCVCQTGFRESENGCQDMDECSLNVDGCSHLCHNTIGSYKCSCQFGYHLANDLKTCLETSPDTDYYVDELEFNKRPNFERNLSFWDGYNDYNRVQEFRAVKGMVCPPGFFFLRNECRDYNECQETPSVCDKDEICMNFPGTYKCLSVPCPPGYQRTPSNKVCIKRCSQNNKCQRGASVSEFVIFRPVTLKLANPLVVHFDEIGEPQCNVAKTRYRVVESSEIFEVRVSNGRGSLHALKRLNSNTLYRAKVESFSYDTRDTLLYFTEFIVFVVAV